MKRAIHFLVCFSLACTAFAGFRVKLIKPKKAEQFQARLNDGEITFAADLVIEGKDQKGYFYKELNPSHVIAIRLAVFNRGRNEVILPVDRLQLIDPSGQALAPLAPEAVAEAILKGLIVSAEDHKNTQVQVAPQMRDPRTDPTDPRYDPRVDPRDPRYDPRVDPSDPRYDPRLDPTRPGYDPNDPRNRRYPNGTYGPWARPGVDVILVPGGGGGSGDLSQSEKSLVEKDFMDKSHSMEPVLPSSGRDKFLYFPVTELPKTIKGFKLRLPNGKGMTQEIVLQF